MERLVSTVATADPEGWKAVWEALACPPGPLPLGCLSGEGAEADQPALCWQGVRSQVFCQPPLTWPEDYPGQWVLSQLIPVAQSCPTLCDPMDHSTPGLPVRHQLPESTQTHVHGVGEAIQPSHVLGGTAFYFIFQTSMEGEKEVPFLLLDEAISGKALCDHFQTPYPPRPLSFSLPSFNGLRNHHCFCSCDCRVQLFVHFLTSLVFSYSNVFLQWKILSKIPPKIPDIGPSDFLG